VIRPSHRLRQGVHLFARRLLEKRVVTYSSLVAKSKTLKKRESQESSCQTVINMEVGNDLPLRRKGGNDIPK